MTQLADGLMMDLADLEGGKYARLAFTEAESDRLVNLFLGIGGMDVRAEPIGDSSYGLRGWTLTLRVSNAAVGNHNVYVVPPESGIDTKRAKAICKDAKAKFKNRDAGSFRRATVARQMDAE